MIFFHTKTITLGKPLWEKINSLGEERERRALGEITWSGSMHYAQTKYGFKGKFIHSYPDIDTIVQQQIYFQFGNLATGWAFYKRHNIDFVRGSNEVYYDRLMVKTYLANFHHAWMRGAIKK